MATFFGEVILPSSRAFWDDKDDSDRELEEAEDKNKRLELNKTEDCGEISSYELMVVIDGPVASGFAKNYLLSGDNGKVIANVDGPVVNDDPVEALSLGRKVRSRPASLYRMKDGTLLLMNNASRPIDIGIANEITLLVAPWLEKCRSVLVVCSRPASDFKYERGCGPVMPDSFLRSLSTSAVAPSHRPDPAIAPTLEQPNFVSGVSASVVSLCEVKRTECLLYVCYSDSVFYGAASMSPLVALFCSDNSPYGHLVSNRHPDMSNQTPNVHLTSMYF